MRNHVTSQKLASRRGSKCGRQARVETDNLTARGDIGPKGIPAAIYRRVRNAEVALNVRTESRVDRVKCIRNRHSERRVLTLAIRLDQSTENTAHEPLRHTRSKVVTHHLRVTSRHRIRVTNVRSLSRGRTNRAHRTCHHAHNTTRHVQNRLSIRALVVLDKRPSRIIVDHGGRAHFSIVRERGPEALIHDRTRLIQSLVVTHNTLSHRTEVLGIKVTHGEDLVTRGILQRITELQVRMAILNPRAIRVLTDVPVDLQQSNVTRTINTVQARLIGEALTRTIDIEHINEDVVHRGQTRATRRARRRTTRRDVRMKKHQVRRAHNEVLLGNEETIAREHTRGTRSTRGQSKLTMNIDNSITERAVHFRGIPLRVLTARLLLGVTGVLEATRHIAATIRRRAVAAARTAALVAAGRARRRRRSTAILARRMALLGPQIAHRAVGRRRRRTARAGR